MKDESDREAGSGRSRKLLLFQGVRFLYNAQTPPDRPAAGVPECHDQSGGGPGRTKSEARMTKEARMTYPE